MHKIYLMYSIHNIQYTVNIYAIMKVYNLLPICVIFKENTPISVLKVQCGSANRRYRGVMAWLIQASYL